MRKGSYFPVILERRRRIDKALYAVVMEAYQKGLSTRKVDELVKAMGQESSISKSEVSRICGELDNAVSLFQNRKLIKKYPYIYFDATYLKVRDDSSVISQAVVVAIGINKDGFKEILGFEVGNTESEQFWSDFMDSLNKRNYLS